MVKITPVILSGGSGTRLWPLSRAALPKQLLALNSDRSMLCETALRFNNDDFSAPIIICNESHRFIVSEQMRNIDITPHSLILEPIGRNTAPAAALAALKLMEECGNQLMLLLPSDHVINDVVGFQQSIALGAQAARNGTLITFGIKPETPETGYGYIRKSSQMPQTEGCFSVESFIEKPNLETAQYYIDTGEYLWNSGMFLFNVSDYIEELERYSPEILYGCRAALAGQSHDLDFLRLDAKAFEQVPSDSIDYAVMEHTKKAGVIPLDVGWNDVGAWSALWELGEKDSFGNVAIGDVVNTDTTGSYLRSEGPLIATIGLTDIVVVATQDVVMVSPKDRVQDVKLIVEKLHQEKRTEIDAHVRVYRPWGWYQSVESGAGFQVKNIQVNPGARLSLQSHKHRSEHWVVVEGEALVTRGDDVVTLQSNQSIYIPQGTVHRLENTTQTPIRIIEIQTGSYLGEDDITRYDDSYGRSILN